MGQLKPNSESHLFFTYSYEKEFKPGQQGSTFLSYLEDAQPDKLSADDVRCSPLPREVLAEGWVLHSSLE